MNTAQQPAVQTSAPQPEPDLFDDAAPLRPEADAQLELACIVIQDAAVRSGTVDREGHTLPILGVKVQACHGLGQIVDVDMTYTEASRELAHQKAATLTRGTKVQILTSLAGMRMYLPHAHAVKVVH